MQKLSKAGLILILKTLYGKKLPPIAGVVLHVLMSAPPVTALILQMMPPCGAECAPKTGMPAPCPILLFMPPNTIQENSTFNDIANASTINTASTSTFLTPYHALAVEDAVVPVEQK